MIDDPGLVWTGALSVCGAILTTYLWILRRRERYDRERLAEAARLGIDRPRGLFPYVDPNICIGCGGCVRACPEGDVLGIVGGLAVVVNGARCIGIGQCAEACPVGGIEIGLGDFRGRADVPVMDDDLQTNVPGVFIAGELGGLALIRNAVEQGRDVVRRIAGELAARPPGGEEGLVDLAIVGAGPAGLSAALAAREQGLSHLILEQEASFGGTVFHYPRRKLTHTQPVDLPLGDRLDKGEHRKEELLERFEGWVERHRLQLRFGERVVDVEGRGGHFLVRTAAASYRARFVLLALGRRGTPRKLRVPGEDLAKVMYQVRDAGLYRDLDILCVGGGDSAVEAAMGLAQQPGNRVTLSYRKEKLFRIKRKNQVRLEKMLAGGRLRTLMPSNVVEIGDKSVRLATAGGELSIDNDLVFVLIGGEPPFPLLKRIGIRFGDEVEGAADPASAAPARGTARVEAVVESIGRAGEQTAKDSRRGGHIRVDGNRNARQLGAARRGPSLGGPPAGGRSDGL